MGNLGAANSVWYPGHYRVCCIRGRFVLAGLLDLGACVHCYICYQCGGRCFRWRKCWPRMIRWIHTRMPSIISLRIHRSLGVSVSDFGASSSLTVPSLAAGCRRSSFAPGLLRAELMIPSGTTRPRYGGGRGGEPACLGSGGGGGGTSRVRASRRAPSLMPSRRRAAATSCRRASPC